MCLFTKKVLEGYIFQNNYLNIFQQKREVRIISKVKNEIIIKNRVIKRPAIERICNGLRRVLRIFDAKNMQFI